MKGPKLGKAVMMCCWITHVFRLPQPWPQRSQPPRVPDEAWGLVRVVRVKTVRTVREMMVLMNSVVFSVFSRRFRRLTRRNSELD